MNVLELAQRLLATNDPYAQVIIGEGTGLADTITKTMNGILLEPLPPVMAETLAAHQPDVSAPCSYCGTAARPRIWAFNEWVCDDQDECHEAKRLAEAADEYLHVETPLPALPQREPGRTLYPELAPEALAEHAPLQTLAADPEDTP